MATVIRHINVNSTPGGTGETNNTTGATRAYASFSEWEAAEQTNLVVDGDNHIVYCDGGRDQAPAFAYTLGGWTTGVGNDIRVAMNPSNLHAGSYDNTKYYLGSPPGSSNSRCLVVSVDFVTLENIQFGYESAWTNHAHALQLISIGAGQIYIEKCIFKYLDPAVQNAARHAIHVSDPDPSIFVSNSVFSDFDYDTASYSENSSAFRIQSTPANLYIQHCTINNCVNGIQGTASVNLTNTRLRNTVFTNCGASSVVDDNGSGWHASSDYNVEDANQAGELEVPGVNTLHNQVITYEDAGNDDYRSSDSDLLISNNLFSDVNYATTEDISNVARPSSGNVYAGIGRVPILGPSIPIIQHHHKQMENY